MKLRAEGTPLAWAGWISLLIVISATLAAGWISRQSAASTLLIEPLPPEILEVTAPDWTQSGATESLSANEEPERELQEAGETNPGPEAQTP
jgi:hypothetical protein